MKKYENYIDGQWLAADDYQANINPSDISDTLGLYAKASEAQLEQALDSARKAQAIWANTGLENRYNILMAIGGELQTRADELGKLLSREEGKPLAEGKGEVFRAGQFFTYYAAEVLRQIGENADSTREGIEVDIRREPVGVVAVISPWNFPLATAVWKIAPALAFGNAVIWKPSNTTPASAWAFAEIMSRQELPSGLFNLVMGSGKTIGNQLINSSKIDAITFTGSVSVGREIALAASANMTKMQMEMGSKNPLVIMDDADLELAVSCAVGGSFGGTGQKCTASSRILVHEGIYDNFVSSMLAATQKLKVGHALDKDTQIGPVVSEEQLKSNLAYMELAEKEGCQVLCGGKKIKLATDGYYMQPAILTGGNNDMRVNKEEMFAPITCIIKVSSYEEALAISNDTPFGLTSGIITQSLARANHYRRNSKTGCVMVNLATAGTDYHVPFGGRGISSYGSREQGRYAIEFYTQVKTAYISAGAPK
jgi:aldehyde dehydrogenase (NAD+)